MERATFADTFRFTFVGTLSLLTLSVSYNILFLASCVSSNNCQTGGKDDAGNLAPWISTLCIFIDLCFHGYRIKRVLTLPTAYVSNATTPVTTPS